MTVERIVNAMPVNAMPVYEQLRYLETKRRAGVIPAGHACSRHGIDPWKYMQQFHCRKFSSDELERIREAYGEANDYERANAIYTKHGYRKKFIDLLTILDGMTKQMQNETQNEAPFPTRTLVSNKIRNLKKGAVIYHWYFRIAERCVNVLPEHKEAEYRLLLEGLESKFLEIYHELHKTRTASSGNP